MARFVGDVEVISLEIRVAGALIDPTTLTFKLKDPNSTITSYVYGTHAQLVKDTTGKYHVNWDVALAGEHVYSWSGTGAAKGVEVGTFSVGTLPPGL